MLRGSATRPIPPVPTNVVDAATAIVAGHDPAARRLPWREGADAWGVLVSEIMSQQTQAERAGQRWREFMRRFPTPAHLADVEVGEVIAMWVGLGYNRRAVNLHRAARAIVADHGGQVPTTREGLLSLPGIGPYTADAVLVFAHEQVVLPVDTNIARILARLSGEALDKPTARAWAQQVAEGAQQVAGDLPSTSPSRAATALMDFGAGLCTARRPGCQTCPVVVHCAWTGGSAPDPAAAGDHRPRPQGRFEGSLRQARGRIVAALREGPLTTADAAKVGGDAWRDAVDGLLADGLVVAHGDAFALPGLEGKAHSDAAARLPDHD